MTGLPSPRGRRRIGAALFAAAAAATVLFAPSGPAGAAPTASVGQQSVAGPDAATCNSLGYGSLGAAGKYDVLSYDRSAVLGYIQVYYSRSLGRNCVQVHSNVYAQSITAGIKLTGSSTWTTDPPAAGQGPYHWYAGPVQSAPSAHHCIDIKGYINQGRLSGSLTRTGVHCG